MKHPDGKPAGASLDPALAGLLRMRKATLSVAESCTGGLLGGRLTALAGASQYFYGGVIAYANAVKTRDLGVPAALIRRDGAVSASVARAMAAGARRRFGTDYALAVTGVAGPEGGTPEKPVGTVWLAAAGPDGACVECLRSASRDRARIRALAVEGALKLLRRTLTESGPAACRKVKRAAENPKRRPQSSLNASVRRPAASSSRASGRTVLK